MSRFVLLLCLAFVVFEAAASNTYRDFTDAQGRTIRGCVVAYDAAKRVVTFERDNRKTSRVPIDIFSEADQKYILKWSNQEGVKSTSKFKISCDRRHIKSWSEEKIGTIHYTSGSVEHDQVTGKMSYDETAYEFVLANRNNYAVTDLLFEYCIYYEQEVGSEDNIKQGILFGSIPIDKLEKGERKMILSNKVVTFKDESDAGFINARVLNGSVLGVAMRLYIQQGEENVLVREMALPSGILKGRAWSTSSVKAGMN